MGYVHFVADHSYAAAVKSYSPPRNKKKQLRGAAPNHGGEHHGRASALDVLPGTEPPSADTGLPTWARRWMSALPQQAHRLNSSCVTKSSSNPRTISLRRRLCVWGVAMLGHPSPGTRSTRTGTYVAACGWSPKAMRQRHLARAEEYGHVAHFVACKLLCSGAWRAWAHHTHRGATRLRAHREPLQGTPKTPRARDHR